VSIEALALLALTISAIGLVGLGVLIRVLLRRLPATKSEDQKPQQPSLRVTSGSPSDNPITRLTFRESFDIGRFAQVSHDCALSHVNEFFRSRVGDGVMVVVNGLLLLPSNVEMTVTVSQAGQILLEQGKAIIARQGNAHLPLLRDLKTGRIIEQMKEAPMLEAFSNLAAVSALAIGAAHLIAGADISNV
jgi:hypothetical protein